MQCSLCGKKEKLVVSIIEGVEMDVCNSCSNLGTQIQIPKKQAYNFNNTIEEFVVENFHSIIKQARERMNLKQEQAAKKLAIKESLIHKMENGSFTPSLRMAKRLEKFYGIKIIETMEGSESTNFAPSGSSYTIADMING